MAAVLKEDSKLSQLLQNPLVDPEKKKAVIKKIAGEAGFSEFTTNFMSLLVDKGRIEAAAEVCSAFEDQYCRLTDTQVAVVKSADKLDQEQQFMIAKKVQASASDAPAAVRAAMARAGGVGRAWRGPLPHAGGGRGQLGRVGRAGPARDRLRALPASSPRRS